LAQLEADCFTATGDLVSNYFRAKLKLELKPASDTLDLKPVLEWEEEVPDTEAETDASDPKAKAKDPKAAAAKGGKAGAEGGMGELPAWLQPLEESAPVLVRP